MNRTFLINILFLVFVNLLVKPFYLFGIDRTVQNTLPAGDYGLFATLFGFSFLFQIINDFGIQGYNNRQIAQHNHLLTKYFPDLLALKGFLGLVYLLVVLLFGAALGYLQQYPFLLLLLIVNHFLTSLALFLRSNVSGLALYRTDSLLSVADRFILILLLGLILLVPAWKAQLRVEYFVLAQTVSLLSSCLLALGALRPHIGALRIQLKTKLLLVILKQSYPYALVVFLMSMYTRLDSVMIERLLEDGLLEVDRYASAYRLLDASNMIGFLFATLLLPMFSRILKAKEHPGALAHFSARLLLAGAITLAIAVIYVRTPLMTALYDDGNAYSGQILAWLMASFVGVCGTYIYGTLLTAGGRLMPMNRLFAFSVLANVVLNILLIPRWGALGAAVATCVTQWGAFLGQLWLARRAFQLGDDWRTVLRLILLTSLLILLGESLQQIFHLYWMVLLVALGVTGSILSFLLRLINLQGIRELLSSKTTA